MNKSEFIEQLTNSLNGLAEEDIKKSVDYYSEMIDDRIEDGIPEEEAVSGLGSLESIVNQILTDTPITKIVKEKIKPKRKLKTWEIVLLIVGSPVWFPILLSLIIVAFALYLCGWIIMLCLYIVDVAFTLLGLGGIVYAFIQENGFNSGLFFAGCGTALIGVSILLFLGFTKISKGLVFATKNMALGIKKLFVGGRKE